MLSPFKKKYFGKKKMQMQKQKYEIFFMDDHTYPDNHIQII